MRARARLAAIVVATAALLSAAAVSGDDAPSRKPRATYFVGFDTSGSFQTDYEDALAFMAYYLYGHLNAMDGLAPPRELFVAAIGGKSGGEPKAFRPVHEFSGKSVAAIESSLRTWYPQTDTMTDFNVFFRHVARIVKERGLQLSPITIIVVSDGVPDVPSANARPGSTELYRQLDFSSLEYLSRDVTVRLLYASPKVGEQWRSNVRRQRVKLWAVEREVMRGWRTQIAADREPAAQRRLWKWVRDNVDFRVRAQAF
jgi:hypothetical protein